MKENQLSRNTLRNKVADINVNDGNYKKQVIKDIKGSRRITKKTRDRLLKTARAIHADSWIMKKSWDKGKIFQK